MMTNADDRRAALNPDVLAYNPEVAGKILILPPAAK
jgi:hypothetical protein